MMLFIKKIILLIPLLITTTQVFSVPFHDDLVQGHVVVQLGKYWNNQGKSQHINIDTLIGDEVTVLKKITVMVWSL